MFERAAELGYGDDITSLRALDATFMKCALSSLVGNCSEKERLIGKTKGGWTSKATFLVDENGRVHGWCLSPGNQHDQKAAAGLGELQEGLIIIADKGYDSKPFRDWLEKFKCMHNIAQKSNAIIKLLFDKELYKKRHVVENVFNHAKWWDRIAYRRERHPDHAKTFINLFCLGTWIAE